MKYSIDRVTNAGCEEVVVASLLLKATRVCVCAFYDVLLCASVQLELSTHAVPILRNQTLAKAASPAPPGPHC